MKPIQLLLILTLFLGMAEQPWMETNHYQTLGFDVIEYSKGYEKAYRIFNNSGSLVAECDLAGFVEWKKRRLMELIGSEYISQAEREQYKLQYEELSRRQDAANQFLFNSIMARRQANQQRLQASSSSVFQNSKDRSQAMYDSWKN